MIDPYDAPARSSGAGLGLHHVQLALPPGREDACREFYVGVLGMTEVRKPPELAARGGLWVRADDLELHLGVEDDFRPQRKAHPGILVADLDALAERLQRAGVAVRPDSLFEGMRRFYADDPNGNRLEFLQPLGTPVVPEGSTMQPIGVVRSARIEELDDDWDAVESTIELDGTRFTGSALTGLDAFSHVEVVYVFDRVAAAAVEVGARHPRGNPDWPEVGIFAQRARMRPNRIGVSVCALLGVTGTTVRVRSLDAIDGSPVLDLKPVMRDLLPRGEVSQPAWATELMAAYW